jgi:hypothetical protein
LKNCATTKIVAIQTLPTMLNKRGQGTSPLRGMGRSPTVFVIQLLNFRSGKKRMKSWISLNLSIEKRPCLLDDVIRLKQQILHTEAL